ncbi:Os09g0392633 [Oryza sativa Japonica Group]|uniref:Os09g0392633 protein n=1 Tax=Oryza sativa subsp. japonica TaxID=39947 RepID=A0A0P0XMW5_ORYSJ|nr:Os09g0392633 [Oryza sativa Japonica Group]
MQRMEKIRCGHRLLRFIAEPQLRHAPVHAVYRIDASGPRWIGDAVHEPGLPNKAVTYLTRIQCWCFVLRENYRVL